MNFGLTRILKIVIKRKSNPIPIQLKLGLSHKLPKDLAPVTIILDATVPNDNDPYVEAGLEVKIQKAFAIRAGFKSGPQKDSGLSAGFSINHLNYSLDFAYQPSGDLGNSYFISLSTQKVKMRTVASSR